VAFAEIAEPFLYDLLIEQYLVNPCGEIDQLIVHLNFAKNGRSEAKSSSRFLLRLAQPF